MGNAIVSDSTLVELALSCTCNPVLRLSLLTAERSNPAGLAYFSRVELKELLSEGMSKAVSRQEVDQIISAAIGQGYLEPRRPKGYLIPNGQHFKPLGYGLSKLADIDDRRVWLQCDCGRKFAALAERFEAGMITCSFCNQTGVG